ncbi:MAG TPA: hypothetical protein VH374_20680 [Polyangia bacterium]|nr:hypothetical protein [Polyangia bacterium]
MLSGGGLAMVGPPSSRGGGGGGVQVRAREVRFVEEADSLAGVPSRRAASVIR